MPKLYDMWTELKLWLAIKDAEGETDAYMRTLDQMDELENEYE